MARSFLTGAALGAIMLTAPLLAQAAPAALVGRPLATQTQNFSVHFPLRNEAQLDQLIELQSNPRSPLYHHFLTPAQFRANYGPAPATFARAAAALRAHGFAITKQTSQSLRVSGATASVERAFRTQLGIVRENGSKRVTSSTALTVPAELSALGATVTGFESRIHVHPFSRQVPLSRRGPYGGYYFTDLKQAYSYPATTSLDGTGAKVGVLMSSDVYDSDTKAQLDHENYTAISGKTPLPLIRETLFGGGGLGGGAFAEASIDVQTSQTSAPGAQIVLYNIPDLSDESVIAGYTDVVESNFVDILSSSFGGCELGYTKAYNGGTDFTGILLSYHELFKQGNSQGITFLASSGDEAGLECPTVSYYDFGQPGHFIPSVSWPADDPSVTAVGGTNLHTTAPSPDTTPFPATYPSKYVSENEYGDPEIPYDAYGFGSNVSGGFWGSGGGTSTIFALPSYQKQVTTGSGRQVPDISMQMGGCPGGISTQPCHSGDSFSIYYLEGGQYGFIGTSLSSPEFAGLLALQVEERKSRIGNVNYYIYGLAAAQAKLPPSYPNLFFHQGIGGYNGVVLAKGGKTGYNQLVGVGTPFAANYLGVPQDPLAGNPQTITNP